jgi:hypothetical protein
MIFIFLVVTGFALPQKPKQKLKQKPNPVA